MKFETMRVAESIVEAAIYVDFGSKTSGTPWNNITTADAAAITLKDAGDRYTQAVLSIDPAFSTVAGNVLGQDGIRLVDIDFPESVLKELPGPMMGIDGIRKLLNVYNRPLVGAILKPCIGVTPDVSAAGALKAAMGGADVIKDDELQSYPEYSPMEKRVRAVMDLLRANGKDKACLYAVNITGENLFDRARRAIDAGANSLMVNYQSMGWGAVEDFIRAMKRARITVPPPTASQRLCPAASWPVSWAWICLWSIPTAAASAFPPTSWWRPTPSASRL